MKTAIFTLAGILFLSSIGLAQYSIKTDKPASLSFEVRGQYNRFVKKETLSGAKSMQDILPGYPANWITTYVSSEISALVNGKLVKALSKDDALSVEQQNLLRSSELASKIEVNIHYKYKEPVTNTIENNKIHVTMTVIPDNEAQFTGGYQELINYFKENTLEKIPEATVKKLQRTLIKFTVNEAGEITNTKLIMGCGENKTDRLLLDLVNKMPPWKPAQNSKGQKVKQDFELIVGNGQSGC